MQFGLGSIALAGFLDPALVARLTSAPRLPRLLDPMRGLIVVERTTKVMRPARTDRRGRHHPEKRADLIVCTHAPRGRSWPRPGPRRFMSLATRGIAR